MDTAKELVDSFRESLMAQFEGVIDAEELPEVAEELLARVVSAVEVALAGTSGEGLEKLIEKHGRDKVVDAFAVETQQAAAALTVDVYKDGVSKEIVQKMISNSKKLVN